MKQRWVLRTLVAAHRGTLLPVKTILLVEDDSSVREAASLVLEHAGLVVEPVSDGRSALDAFASGRKFDLVLLDVMLPGANGFEVCRTIRQSSEVPIVMLTARSDVADVVTGLEFGADDYITKPVEAPELVARVRAALRRSDDWQPGAPAAAPLECRDITVDETAARVRRGSEDLHLTVTEFRLLAEFIRHAGKVITRESFLERVWGYDYLGDSRLVDVAVKRLRSKLGSPPEPPEYITTVRGRGYRFEKP